ncbi:MAG: PAS domain S-box protein [Candidatus Rokubacteria bacterium]|nr:PAS domain S-box protein [Candidatus Rokubacteria bacterium]
MPENTILVVDDTDDARAITSLHLTGAGYTVIEAATGLEALVHAASQPDLIILDIHLPDIDGFEVCRRLRASPATASIPILYLSAAHRASRDRVRGLELGADAYLTQPAEPDELLATVGALLRIRRAETRLRATQERYRRVVDTALEGIWSIDADGHTTYVNRQMAAMLGCTADEMLGCSLCDFVDPALRAVAERHFERRKRGIRDQQDLRFRRKDGSVLWAIVSAIPIVGDDGVFVGAVAVVTDITDRKRAERAEQRAEMLHSIASLANAASHEINNPLTVIVGTLELLDRKADLDAGWRVRVLRAVQAARDIQDSIRRMSRITRLESVDHSPDLPPMLDLERSSLEGIDRPHA